jgi:hypothetical protein
MEERSSSSGIGMKIIAGLVLAVAAWILFKIVIGIVAGLATTFALIVLVVAIFWAWRQF